MARKREQPQQPLVWSRRNSTKPVIRFQANDIVRDLLDFAQDHGFGLNEIAVRPYRRDDREQLAQLIGYSVSGFGELSYARKRVVLTAAAEADRMYARRYGRRPSPTPDRGPRHE